MLARLGSLVSEGRVHTWVRKPIYNPEATLTAAQPKEGCPE